MLRTVLLVAFVLVSLGLIALVLLQPGKSAGLSGSIAGGAETFFGKKKGINEKLEAWTKYVAFAFMVLALLLTIL
ncbi:MAG: preprotein translocase subunit SecG [Bacillota bacterium]|nr:preprotein translocase subunit SecG [Bacillota bacterium]MDK2926217.1 preprotein translocase subunit SecG [Bacillota bacterium]